MFLLLSGWMCLEVLWCYCVNGSSWAKGKRWRPHLFYSSGEWINGIRFHPIRMDIIPRAPVWLCDQSVAPLKQSFLCVLHLWPSAQSQLLTVPLAKAVPSGERERLNFSFSFFSSEIQTEEQVGVYYYWLNYLLNYFNKLINENILLVGYAD